MALSNDLISQFAKVTKNDKKTKTDTTVYGKIVVHNGQTFTMLDGSNLLTPISTTADVKNGERVLIKIKNHTATVTGNVTSPSASAEDVVNVTNVVSGMETVMAYKVTTEDLEAVNGTFETLKAHIATLDGMESITADIEALQAKYADLTHVTANDVDVLNADIENLKASIGEFTDISTDDLEAINANIDKIKGRTADFTYVSADILTAVKASVDTLDTEKLSAKDAELTYVNIDFSNINEAQMNKFYAKSGLIQEVFTEDATITGYLVGVTIKGDLIDGNTIVADKLVIRGDDGLYYKLNFEGGTFSDSEVIPTDSLHGSVITAKSVTADRISVSDLVAFDATIGGFNIGEKSIYSGVKATADNTTRGIYLDKDGQFIVGDMDNYFRYYKTTDSDGNEIYKLEISAESILFGANTKASVADLQALTEHVKIGTYTDPETSQVEPSIELAEGDSDFKQILTNTKVLFMDGSDVATRLDTEGITAINARIKEELRLGGFIWTSRANGNCGMMWKGESS